jgi:Domain of unknown function (DUF6985)
MKWLCIGTLGVVLGPIALIYAVALVLTLRDRFWAQRKATWEPDPNGPFPPLIWTGDDWEGTGRFPFWARHSERLPGDDDTDDESQGLFGVTVIAGPNGPSAAQARAYRFLTENDEAVGRTILSGVAQSYRETLEHLRNETAISPRQFEHEFPAGLGPNDFRERIDFGAVFVLQRRHNDVAYTGFSFAWWVDEEHGLGVVMHQDRCVAVTDASGAFSEDFDDPDERHSGE